MHSEYWENYNPSLDFNGLSPSIQSTQSATGSTLNSSGMVRAGYDPIWVFETFGDRLRLLPSDLYGAVFEAIQQGTILSNQWAENAALFLPELGIQTF